MDFWQRWRTSGVVGGSLGKVVTFWSRRWMFGAGGRLLGQVVDFGVGGRLLGVHCTLIPLPETLIPEFEQYRPYSQ